MTAYGLTLRHSPLRWWFPVLLAIDLLTVFVRDLWWVGVWPQASAAAQLPSTFLGPAVAGAAAWLAGNRSRRQWSGLQAASALPPWRAELAQLLVPITYGLGAYVVGVIGALAVSRPTAGPGVLWPGYLVLGATIIVLCGAAGHLAGRVLGSSLVTPVVCLVVGLLVIQTTGDAEFLGLFVMSGGPESIVRWQALAGRLALALGVLVVAVAPLPQKWSIPSWKRRSSGRLGLAVSLGALPLAVVAFVASGPLLTPRTPPASPLCTTTVPQICVWPEERRYLPELTAIAQRLAALPADTVTVPPVFYERGLRAAPGTTNDFGIIEGSMWSVTPSLVGTISEASFPDYCDAANTAAEDARTQAYFELGTWIEARANGAGQPADVHGGPPGVDLAAIGNLITQPEPAQKAWVAQRLDVIRTTPCA